MKKIIYVSYFFFFFSLIVPLYSFPIDLTENDIFVRQGFDLDWISSLPDEDDKNWIPVPGRKGNRSVILNELDIPGVDSVKKFQFENEKPEIFTLITHFNIEDEIRDSRALGLYLAQIGMNWEVYLNGHPVRSELFLNKDGDIYLERAVRGAVIELGHDYFKSGTNVLAFKIIGSPSENRTGLFMKDNYYIDSIVSIYKTKDETFILMLISIYLFFGFFHVVLYLMRRKERSDLFYGIGSIVMALFFFCRTETVFSMVVDTHLIKQVELFTLFSILPVLGIFGELIIRGRVSLFVKIYTGLSMIMAITQIFLFQESILRLWQYTTPLVLLYFLVYDGILPSINQSKTIYKKNSTAGTLKNIWSTFITYILTTVTGNLLIGFIIIIVTVIIDIRLITAGYQADYSQYGFFLFFTGIGVILANRFIKAHNLLETMNIYLEKKVEERTGELQSANEELTAINEELIITRNSLWGEMKVAKKIQTVLLPREPVIDGYLISAYMKPADEIGGDYYDIINAGNRDWLVIGDVSGHGVPAGLVMMMTQTCIQLTLDRNPDIQPSILLKEVNATITNNINKLGEDRYITLTVLACISDGTFYFSGLHEDILIYRKNTGKVEAIRTEGVWLGLFDDISDMFHDKKLIMDQGDVMVLYTDGITEAWRKGSIKNHRSIKEDMFGISGLVDAVAEQGGNSPDDIKNNILHKLENYELHDDITMVVIKRS